MGSSVKEYEMKPEYVVLRLRNALGVPFKPERELAKLQVLQGQRVLDYGCGIGSFALPVARRVGTRGRVFALDRDPSALETVRRAARRKGLTNIETIHSDCDTHLSDHSVDWALFIGVLPYLAEATPVLVELHRVLKADGVLVTRHCFRIGRAEVVQRIGATGLFSVQFEKGHILGFAPV
jgi:ubiquinone/menaquinone biosynthesis C-methylase UbiE